MESFDNVMNEINQLVAETNAKTNGKDVSMPTVSDEQDGYQQLAAAMARSICEAAEATAAQLEEQAERRMNEAQSFLQQSKIVAARIREIGKEQAATSADFIGQRLRSSSLALHAVANKFDIEVPATEKMNKVPSREGAMT